MDPVAVRAVVRVWNDHEGWGVLDSPATPGGCWAHFSALDVGGYATAAAGQKARLVYERAQQDGFDWRAVSVLLDGVPPRADEAESPEEAGGAYSSDLNITFD